MEPWLVSWPTKTEASAEDWDQRPAFDQMLKDAVRRRFDASMV